MKTIYQKHLIGQRKEDFGRDRYSMAAKLLSDLLPKKNRVLVIDKWLAEKGGAYKGALYSSLQKDWELIFIDVEPVVRLDKLWLLLSSFSWFFLISSG